MAPYFENRSESAIRETLEPIVSTLEDDGNKDSCSGRGMPDLLHTLLGLMVRRCTSTLRETLHLPFSGFRRSCEKNYTLQEGNIPLLNLLRVGGIGAEEIPLTDALRGRKFVEDAERSDNFKSLIDRVRRRPRCPSIGKVGGGRRWIRVPIDHRSVQPSVIHNLPQSRW